MFNELDPFGEEEWDDSKNVDFTGHKIVRVIEHYGRYCVFDDRWVRPLDELTDRQGNTYKVGDEIKIGRYMYNTVAEVYPVPYINQELIIDNYGSIY